MAPLLPLWFPLFWKEALAGHWDQVCDQGEVVEVGRRWEEVCALVVAGTKGFLTRLDAPGKNVYLVG